MNNLIKLIVRSEQTFLYVQDIFHYIDHIIVVSCFGVYLANCVYMYERIAVAVCWPGNTG